MTSNHWTKKLKGIKEGWRSGLEKKQAAHLDALGVKYEYEKRVVEYITPPKKHRYTPDFELLDNGIIVETKGRFVAADRAKHLLVKEQHPELDIRFVFSNSKTKLYKGSPTSYADWCEKHGFQYADKIIPASWLSAPPSVRA